MRRPSKAWGEVTSWTRWRSMNSRSGSPSAVWTTWRSQTFSLSVRARSVLMGCCSLSTLRRYLDDLDPQGPARGLVLDDVAGALAHERLAQRRTWRHDVELLVLLLDRTHEEALGLVVSLVADGDDRSGCHPARLGRRPVDQHGARQGGLELADSGLHLPLAVLGCVVVAVL